MNCFELADRETGSDMYVSIFQITIPISIHFFRLMMIIMNSVVIESTLSGVIVSFVLDSNSQSPKVDLSY